MTVDVAPEIRIERPRDEVAAYVTDWRNDPTWIRALRDVRLVTDPPFGVGSRVARIASFLGRRMEYVNEVVAWDERRFAMRAVSGPFPMTVDYEFEDADGGGTLMRIRARGGGSGFYRVAGPALAAAVKRGIAGDLRKLKSVLEGA